MVAAAFVVKRSVVDLGPVNLCPMALHRGGQFAVWDADAGDLGQGSRCLRITKIDYANRTVTMG